MIPRDGNMVSLWQQSVGDYEPVNKPVQTTIYDVVIIGGGITGISTALLLQKAGKKCLVLEAHNLCFGTTGGTTAHINTLLDTSYLAIEKNFNKEKAKLVASSTVEAINAIQDNIEQYNIDCDFKMTTATLVAKNDSQKEELEKISKATIEAGIKNIFVEDVSIPVHFLLAMKVYDQAKFNPVRYVHALASEFEKLGGVIVQQCRLTKADENQDIDIETSKGKFKSHLLIYATHIPPGVNLLHLRCVPYRSYAMAVTLKNKNSYPDDLIYDMFDPYHYYRSQVVDGKQYLIVGGYDHKTGEAVNEEYAFIQLETHIRKHFQIADIAYKWSSQYFEPADGIPYIGQLPGHQNIFVATGYGGNGITYSTVAARLLKSIVCGEDSPYKDLYDPNRLKPVAGFKNFVSHNADVVKKFVSKFFSHEEMQELAELASGEGKIVNYKNEKIAIFKDEQGNVHALSPICRHLGCEVSWNNAEQTWDCPCHGARYSYDGDIITGPASEGLAKINIRELVAKEE